MGLAACTVAVSAATAAAAADTPVQPNERLSDWLLRQPATHGADPLALSWRSAADVPEQISRQRRLVEALQQSAPELAAFVRQLPATGRQTLPNADARWLQANPPQDPVLRPGDSVQLPRRSEWVTVLTPNGFLCLVAFQPGMATSSYLNACGQLRDSDTAWLVQTDGRVLRQDIQHWNAGEQVPPAPGAWLWAPARTSPVSQTTSQQLAQFLATQGQAPGAAERLVLERHEVSAPIPAVALRDLPVTTNDWGVIGLWQTPTARLGKAGSANFTFSRNDPYANITMQLQPFDWLSGAFRYTDVMTRAYGPAAYSGDQTYKDKSVDLKLRLREESDWLPQVALGWRDLLGTGIFSGEYVVANKRYGDLDFSLGLGWGYVGKRGDIRNPLGRLAQRMDQRPTSSDPTGGKFNAKAYFRGPSALFGGVQWHTPWDQLIIKAEYEGNDYRHEPFGFDLKAKSAINVGAVWRARPWLDLSLNWQRGQQLGFSLSTNANLDGLHTPKSLDPKPVTVAANRPAQVGDPARTARDLEAQTGLRIDAIEQRDHQWMAVAANPSMGFAAPVVERALAVLHRDAPPDADRLGLRFEQRGNAISEVTVDRDRWATNKTQRLPDSLKPPPPALQPPATPRDAATAPVFQRPNEGLSWGVNLSYRQSLGGADAFVLYQFAADLDAEWRLRKDTWLSGTYRVRLLDNYDRYRDGGRSNLPRVRTLVREYTTTSRDTLPNLQLTHMGQAGSNHFYLAYAGMLESMFAGVGGEYLYRPVGSRVAVGIDINKVQQRTFDQKFSLRSYRVNTGHLTLYWDTGFHDLMLSASAGQYLAGDRGGTLNVSRMFHNGVSVGAYASKTNVSAQQFGEGSFDKGIYLNIPFDVMLPRSGPSSAVIVYAPLLRDGGAKLGKRYNLHDLTTVRDPRTLTIGATPP